MIPSLLLQPFVENSIWHGLVQNDNKDGLIEIEISKSDDLLFFLIKDNGIGRAKAKEINLKKNKNHISMGTNITESRLKLLNKSKKYGLFIEYIDMIDEFGNATGTTVKIRVPIKKK